MRKIGKLSVILSSLLLATLISISNIEPAEAYINRFSWDPPYEFRGYDSIIYDENIIAYIDGTTASIRIPVEGEYSPYMNVTAVSIVFDTGLNETLDYTANPVKIEYEEVHSFVISFTADVSELSNEWAHDYWIYVKFNYPFTDYWSVSWSYWYPAYRFVVFTADQDEAMQLYWKYYSYRQSYPPTDFIDIEARLLAIEADVEGTSGGLDMGTLDFTAAKEHFQTAVDLYEQAFTAEEVWGTQVQEAELEVFQKEADAALANAEAAQTEADAALVEAEATQTEADASTAEAEASMKQAEAAMKAAEAGYVWMFFGFGWILIGIGVIVYGWRKPKTPQ